jgi:hypothetical protein
MKFIEHSIRLSETNINKCTKLSQKVDVVKRAVDGPSYKGVMRENRVPKLQWRPFEPRNAVARMVFGTFMKF